MALGLTITSIGRDDLALAISQTNSLTITNIVLTNAQTTGTLADIQTSSQLGGTAVATLSATGRRIAEGKVQVEGSDNSSNTYEAKTLALTYTKNGQTRVFALYTSATTFIYKVSDTAVMIAAAIAIEDSQASSITFSNVTLSFPAATASALGSVKLATASQVESAPAVDAANPIVTSAQVVSNVLKNTLGENCTGTNKQIDVKKTLTVGQKDLIEGSYDTDRFTLDSGYYAIEYYQPGTSIRIPDVPSLTNGDAYWTIDGTYSGTFKSYNVLDLYDIPILVDQNGKQVGAIMPNTNRTEYTIRISFNPTTKGDEFSIFELSKDSSIVARKIEANVEATLVEGEKVKSGGDKRVSFTSSDFYESATEGAYYFGKRLDISMVRGNEYFIPYLTIGGELLTGTYSSSELKRTWTKNGRTYSYSYSTKTFACSGGIPEAGSIVYTEKGEIESSCEVKAYGLSLSRCVAMGLAKVFLSKTSSSASTTASTSDSYNMTVTLSSSGTLTLTYSGPKLNGPTPSKTWFEVHCDENVFVGNTRHTMIEPATGTDASGRLYVSISGVSLASVISGVPLLVKVY